MKRVSIIMFFFALIFSSASPQQYLSLERVRELALKNDRNLQNAAIGVDIALQDKKTAFTKYFPGVSASGLGFVANKPIISTELDFSSMMQPLMETLTPTIGWLMMQGAPLDPVALQNSMKPQKIEALQNGIHAGITATQPLYAGGQIRIGNKLADVGVAVSKLQQEIAENELLLDAERYYWQLVMLKEKIKTIDNSDSLLSAVMKDVKTAIAAGLTTRNDLLRVELEKNKLESGKLKAENGMTMLKIGLGRRIGMSAIDFDILLPTIGEVIPEVVTADSLAVGSTPEYKLLEKSVEAARLQQKMELGKNLPTVALGASYNVMNMDKSKNGLRNAYAMVFANVSIPISDWWSGTYAIKQKKLEIQKAENSKRENNELLMQKMQFLQNEVNEAFLQIRIANKAIVAANENLKINRDNFLAGITGLTDLLTAQNLLRQAQDQHTEAATSYFMKLAEFRLMNR